MVAYLTPQNLPGAVRFTPRTFDFSSPIFTGVTGEVTAHFEIPNGYTLDGEVTLKTPLTTTLFHGHIRSRDGKREAAPGAV